MCSIYTNESYYNIDTVVGYDNTIGADNTKKIWVKDYDYTDATAFKNAMKGVYLYYELATEKTISVDGNEAVMKLKDGLGGLSFSASGTTLTITDGTNTWTLSQ